MRRSTLGAAALVGAALASLTPPAAAQPYVGRDGWGYHHRYDRYRHEDRRYGYAWRDSYGWAGAYGGGYAYRGRHYCGYWDDGTGRRFYDCGGFGVGHFDYGR